MISTIITAFISFASTNIDDIFILMLFFSQINNGMEKRHIIIGQYLGIILLITISIIGALGVSLIPSEYVGLLGLVPIYLGVKAYIGHKKDHKNNVDIGQRQIQNSEDLELIKITDIKEEGILSFVMKFINPSAVKVLGLTFANGADNIGIYIPLFSSMSLRDIFITVIVFMFLTALWCFIGMKLAEHSLIQRIIEKYKNIFIPIVFIGLGIFILIESETISFIIKKIF
ncbi:CadD family cadmium resistance transporter [Clostridium subterminale]|uniref:CadD family cadmium resistance transporter n=1 Tax=Clostridium subterminale TaxID=1550 RepID=A0ABP3W8I9_CLOSU